nr:hypothetical protein [Nocardioides lianchengensis]
MRTPYDGPINEDVTDLLYLALTLLAFVAMALLTRALDR